MILRRGAFVAQELPAPPYVAATTYLVAPPGRVGAVFRRASRAVQASLAVPSATHGLLRYGLQRRFPGREFWTLTVWADEPAMRAFVRSTAHASAMAAVPDSRNFGRFAHWATDDPMVRWEDAYRQLGQAAPRGWLLEAPGSGIPSSWRRPPT